MLKTPRNNQQSGAVSLFVVMFAALLITVVTVSFIRIMVQDQQQATTVDLSQSAYDSAQAGVEDAKRALLRYKDICDNSGDVACAEAAAQVNSLVCNEALSDLQDITIDNNEIKIQSGSNNNSLDQAYTCVKIALDTEDYLGSLLANTSQLVPLKVADGESFSTVRLQWYSSVDLGSTDNFEINLQSASSSTWPLLSQNAWPTNRPSIMRAQLIQFGDNGFRLSDFDGNSATESNTNTLFLYPSGDTGVASSEITSRAFVERDIRKTPTGTPLPINCSGNISAGGYACTVDLQLPTPINGGERTAFLKISALYNGSHYRVTLLDGAIPTKFSAVQPEVDSTGRANSLFRRVKARVELLDTTFSYPDATIDISGNFCKDFLITDTQYQPGSCTSE